MAFYGGYKPYVSAAKRRQKALQALATRQKQRNGASPVLIEGRTIAQTFWGKAWCENLEAYSDYANRLPRGRTYVRNGSVVDLQIAAGKITAIVSGSSLYEIEIAIRPLERARWKSVIAECSGKIDSLVELLQGRLSRGVMEVLAKPGAGLFPKPAEITLRC